MKREGGREGKRRRRRGEEKREGRRGRARKAKERGREETRGEEMVGEVGRRKVKLGPGFFLLRTVSVRL